MAKEVAETESPCPGVPFRRFLNRDGQLVAPPPGFAQDASDLLPLYRAMVLTRTFDEKAVALQRTGRLGTYPSSLGQEAVTVGIGSAMRPEDVLLPSFREQGAQLWRGVGMAELLLYWGGDERGSDFARSHEDFPICIPVASHAPHAAGVALAFKLRGEARAAVCVMGDGGTSKGDFYEALNLAGIWRLPVVFVINNNQWAISVPRAAQTAAETLAQKGIAAGVEGIQVDGNDVIAVRDTLERSLAKARSSGGATLIEALTYRFRRLPTACCWRPSAIPIRSSTWNRRASIGPFRSRSLTMAPPCRLTTASSRARAATSPWSPGGLWFGKRSPSRTPWRPKASAPR